MIQHDGIAVFCVQLMQRIGPCVLRFEREPHNEAMLFSSAKLGEHVCCFDQLDCQRTARFLQLAGRPITRPVVAHRRGADDPVAVVELRQAYRKHFCRRLDEMHGTTRRRGQRHRARNQYNVVPAPRRRLGNGVPHPPARGIGKKPHIVEIFARRAGGDEEAHRGLFHIVRHVAMSDNRQQATGRQPDSPET